jgi:DNA-binding transcriptional LysR family regulator
MRFGLTVARGSHRSLVNLAGLIGFALVIPIAHEALVTLNQLRTFLAVAEHESVRGAAQELVVTQAAVSASIAALQKGLGLALVTPDGRGLRLTKAGKAYAGYARRIIGLLDEAGLAAAASADPERGELRIAAVTTAAEQVVPHILGGFRRQHPLTGIRLEAGNRERVRSLLERHQVDLVVTGRPEPGWEVDVHAVRPHELVVVAAPDLAADAVRHRRPGRHAGIPRRGRRRAVHRAPRRDPGARHAAAPRLVPALPPRHPASPGSPADRPRPAH